MEIASGVGRKLGAHLIRQCGLAVFCFGLNIQLEESSILLADREIGLNGFINYGGNRVIGVARSSSHHDVDVQANY